MKTFKACSERVWWDKQVESYCKWFGCIFKICRLSSLRSSNFYVQFYVSAFYLYKIIMFIATLDIFKIFFMARYHTEWFSTKMCRVKQVGSKKNGESWSTRRFGLKKSFEEQRSSFYLKYYNLLITAHI